MYGTVVWQPTLWLETDTTGSSSDIYGGLIQQEENWLVTDGYSNVVLTVTQYYIIDQKTELLIEGTDEPAGGWNLVERLNQSTGTPESIYLSKVRQRSDTAGRLWRFLRWRWAPDDTGGTMASARICFKIKVVMK